MDFGRSRAPQLLHLGLSVPHNIELAWNSLAALYYESMGPSSGSAVVKPEVWGQVWTRGSPPCHAFAEGDCCHHADRRQPRSLQVCSVQAWLGSSGPCLLLHINLYIPCMAVVLTLLQSALQICSVPTPCRDVL